MNESRRWRWPLDGEGRAVASSARDLHVRTLGLDVGFPSLEDQLAYLMVSIHLDSELVAYVTAEDLTVIGEPMWWVRSLVVDLPVRRLGLGRGIVKDLAAWAESEDVKWMGLELRPDADEWLEQFYRDLGFAWVSEVDSVPDRYLRAAPCSVAMM